MERKCRRVSGGEQEKSSDSTASRQMSAYKGKIATNASVFIEEEGGTMSETATLDAARENAEAVSHLIEQYLGRNGQARNGQDIVRFARLLWFIVRDIWEQFQLRLDQGLESGRARHAAASADLACDSLLRVIGQLKVTLQPNAGEHLEGFAELLAAVPKVREIQNAARHLTNSLNAPEPPIDEARLAEGLAAAARGDFEDTGAIVERLRAGGEL
jgi:hypothetical protein